MIGDEFDIGMIELLDISVELGIERPFYTGRLARYLREVIEDARIVHHTWVGVAITHIGLTLGDNANLVHFTLKTKRHTIPKVSIDLYLCLNS